MQTFRCAFIQVYGLTETTGAITQLAPAITTPTAPARAAALGGQAFRGSSSASSIRTGDRAHAGEVGELWTRSVQNMKGYWKQPDETARTFAPDGWLKTGDAGYSTRTGYVFLTDRVKDMIVSGGENIYPAEVENALPSHPASRTSR